MVNRIWKLVLVGIVLSLLATEARADDKKAGRDRAAKAALALAAAGKAPAITTAPQPRPAVRCYPTGCQAAKDAGKPLVVYVACPAVPVEGAIVAQCSVETFGETTGPAIVVGYPRGDRMYVESTLACDAKPADIQRAVKEAAKKSTPPPKQMPAAAEAESWRISFSPPCPCKSCSCGPDCKCGPGACECAGCAQSEYRSLGQKPKITESQDFVITASASGGDGLAEVNALRAARGLRPFAHDPGLAAAAKACAEYRAAHLMFGHTSNDFGFLAAGVKCDATGCAAYPPSYGWLSCATYDAYDRAGAWWTLGRDGKRYMHLYVGQGSPRLTIPNDSAPRLTASSSSSEPAVITYREVTHPDTTGRMARWNVPSDSRRPWIFLGYVDATTVQPGWEMTPFVKPYYAGGYCLPGKV